MNNHLLMQADAFGGYSVIYARATFIQERNIIIYSKFVICNCCNKRETNEITATFLGTPRVDGRKNESAVQCTRHEYKKLCDQIKSNQMSEAHSTIER